MNLQEFGDVATEALGLCKQRLVEDSRTIPKGLLWIMYSPLWQERHGIGTQHSTCHIVSTLRKQGKLDVGAQHVFSFSFSLRSQSMEWCHPYLEWLSLHSIWNSPKDTSRSYWFDNIPSHTTNENATFEVPGPTLCLNEGEKKDLSQS